MAQPLRFQPKYDAHVRARYQRWGDSLDRLQAAMKRIHEVYRRKLGEYPIGQDDFLGEVEWLAAVAEAGQ